MGIDVKPLYNSTGVRQYMVTLEETDDEHQIAGIVEIREDREKTHYWWCYKCRRSHGINSPNAPPCAHIKALADGYAWRGPTGEQDLD